MGFIDGFKQGWEQCLEEEAIRHTAEEDANDPWNEGRLTALRGGRRRRLASAAWKRGFDHGAMERQELEAMSA